MEQDTSRAIINMSAGEFNLEDKIRQVANRLMIAMLITGGSIIASLLYVG